MKLKESTHIYFDRLDSESCDYKSNDSQPTQEPEEIHENAKEAKTPTKKRGLFQ